MINPIIYFLLFLKASLFSSGGFSNLPSLHQDMIASGWAKEIDFGQSIAIGQISPGPNGLWVISLGYLTYGYAGAGFALIAITLPALLVLLISAGYARIASKAWVQGAMHGVSLAVVGLLVTVVWTILHQPGVDWRGLLIAAGAFGLAFSRKINLLLILALAGIAGYLLYGL
jgi:chromate transporter